MDCVPCSCFDHYSTCINLIPWRAVLGVVSLMVLRSRVHRRAVWSINVPVPLSNLRGSRLIMIISIMLWAGHVWRSGSDHRPCWTVATRLCFCCRPHCCPTRSKFVVSFVWHELILGFVQVPQKMSPQTESNVQVWTGEIAGAIDTVSHNVTQIEEWINFTSPTLILPSFCRIDRLMLANYAQIEATRWVLWLEGWPGKIFIHLSTDSIHFL